jgi:hypothetical protein
MLPLLPNMVPQGINQAGLMTGWLSNQAQPGVQGFLMDRQSFVGLVFPDDGSGQFRPSLITEPIGLNDQGWWDAISILRVSTMDLWRSRRHPWCPRRGSLSNWGRRGARSGI